MIREAASGNYAPRSSRSARIQLSCCEPHCGDCEISYARLAIISWVTVVFDDGADFGTALFLTGVLTGEAALAGGFTVGVADRVATFGAGAFDADTGFLLLAMIKSPLSIQKIPEKTPRIPSPGFWDRPSI